MTKGPVPKTHVQPGNGPSRVQLNLGGNIRRCVVWWTLHICLNAALRVLNLKRFIHPTPHLFVVVSFCTSFTVVDIVILVLECELAKCQTKLLIVFKNSNTLTCDSTLL